jgi:hypothetical protein
MNDKVRGGISMAVGLFAVFEGFVLWQKHPGITQSYLEFGLGMLAIALGVWRYNYKPRVDPRIDQSPK